ncbi:MAG: type II methionyl aminopeptidase [Candidatus Thermoplasmatota archaeon]|nr:type II methionyl aminopeptidase [Candidatus Thermoplasmatota archaeon]
MIPKGILEKYRKAGRIAAEARAYGAKLVKENLSLLELAEKIESFILNKGAKPAFPVNIGVNEIAAHFTPKKSDTSIFKFGELVKIDLGAHVEGYIADTAITVEVGTNRYRNLIEASSEALSVAVELLKPRVELSAIGACIDAAIKSKGFKAVRNLTGHSMDRYRLHAGKSIPNIKTGGRERIEAGEVLAVEPFATNGSGRVNGSVSGSIYRLVREREPFSRKGKILFRYIKENFGTLPFAERWCYGIVDKPAPALRELMKARIVVTYPILKEVANSVVSQAEHTVLVTDTGCEVIT